MFGRQAGPVGVAQTAVFPEAVTRLGACEGVADAAGALRVAGGEEGEAGDGVVIDVGTAGLGAGEGVLAGEVIALQQAWGG